MQFFKNRPRLTGFLLAISLTGCAAATIVGAGCNAYAEQRLTIPWEDLALAPIEVVRWVNLTDARMTRTCTGG